MPYKISTLQNTSSFSDEKPTIVIQKHTPEWDNAYQNWIIGKNPTDSPEWKKGVFATFVESNI